MTAIADDAAVDAAYWRFAAAVAARQLREWLPATPVTVLDACGTGCRAATVAAAAGHRVVELREQLPPGLAPDVPTVVADTWGLAGIAPDSVDAALLSDRPGSPTVAAEITLRNLARVLRPGGRVLVSVGSLVAGLARLAQEHRWAELVASGSDDVVLLPSPGGGVRRCFWPDELADALTGAGFDVEWVRPRTVLTPEQVGEALAADPDALPRLVSAELALARERDRDPVGTVLVASAVRR